MASRTALIAFSLALQLLKELTEEFGVIINFPKNGDSVTIRGGVELVAQTIARIQQLVEDWV